MTPPVFVVVGHANRGKSSIVSTLAADESVPIGPLPGTTTECARYPMSVHGETLYTLVDTPGFERPHQALEWLRAEPSATADRAERVREFIRVHRGGDRFAQECALLEPVLQGGAVLYVVDASIPVSSAAEAEAEILRWTGRPRMALLNPIGARDYRAEWQPVLDQYFSLVRVFDAQRADFSNRIELLQALRELSEDWRAALGRAIEALQADRANRLQQSAGAIADALVDMLTHTEELRLAPGTDPKGERPALEARYRDSLRRRERALFRALREIYALQRLEVEAGPVADRVAEDLFDTSTWSRLGLSRAQLLATGAAGGAAAGGALDLAVGGASLLAGAVLGGVAGLATTWWAWDRLAEVEVLGQTLGGVLLRAGPARGAAFPWVLLDRALLFHREAATRAHARREPLRLAEGGGIVANLPAERRRRFESCFARLRSGAGRAERSSVRLALSRELEALLPEDEAV